MLRHYFDPKNLDDSMGGQIPVDTAWDKDVYGERMSALDADVERELELAEARLASGDY